MTRPSWLRPCLLRRCRVARLDLYGHLYPDDIDRYADRLDTVADEASEAEISPNQSSKSAARETSSP